MYSTRAMALEGRGWWCIVLVLVALAPIPALAQPSAPRPIVGVLHIGPEKTETAGQARRAFERGLMDAGWVPGRTIQVEYRYAGGNTDRLDQHARELAALPAAVIVARANRAILAATRATTTIPIVMGGAGQDPVEAGWVASLARPGGNVTGLTLLVQDLLAKQLELLRQVAPHVAKVAVIGSASAPLGATSRQKLDTAAQTMGVHLHYLDVQSASDIEPVFDQMQRARVGGVLVRADPIVLEANQLRFVSRAAGLRVPAMYWLASYVRAGGLMSYGPDLSAVHERSASFVDRILRGARPGDLPIEEPAKFDLLVNGRTARTLGLTLPPSLLARASEVLD